MFCGYVFVLICVWLLIHTHVNTFEVGVKRHPSRCTGTTKNLDSGSSRFQEKNCQVRTWSCPTHSQRPSKTSQGLCFPMKWRTRGSSPNQHCIKVRRQKVEGLALGKWVQDEVAGRTESVSRDDILSVQSSPCTCTSFLALYLWYSVLKACKP